MRPQLIGCGHPVTDQVLAGPAGPPQRDRRVAVTGQRHQPSPVGPQRVGQHERIEAIIFVAGRAVAARRFFTWFGLITTTLIPASHKVSTSGPSGRSIETSSTRCRRNRPSRSRKSCRTVLNGAAADLAATRIDHRHRVILTSPIHPGGDIVDGLVRQITAGRLHVSLLAASPSGEAPVTGAGTLPLRSLNGAHRRTALSTVPRPG